jgi:hypothetical protein
VKVPIVITSIFRITQPGRKYWYKVYNKKGNPTLVCYRTLYITFIQLISPYQQRSEFWFSYRNFGFRTDRNHFFPQLGIACMRSYCLSIEIILLGFKIIGCLNKPSSFGKCHVAILHRIDWLKHFTILEVCRLNSQCHTGWGKKSTTVWIAEKSKLKEQWH